VNLTRDTQPTRLLPASRAIEYRRSEIRSGLLTVRNRKRPGADWFVPRVGVTLARSVHPREARRPRTDTDRPATRNAPPGRGNL
jgi:hypothetical protein